jgi:hypothetical protein
VGVPANIPVEVGQLPEDLPLDIVKKNVDELIARAMAERPDLAASRFAALAAQSRIRSVAAEGLPKLSLNANGYRTFYSTPNGDADSFSTTYLASCSCASSSSPASTSPTGRRRPRKRRRRQGQRGAARGPRSRTSGRATTQTATDLDDARPARTHCSRPTSRGPPASARSSTS